MSKKKDKPAPAPVDVITLGQVMAAARAGDMAVVAEYKKRAGSLPAGVQRVIERQG